MPNALHRALTWLACLFALAPITTTAARAQNETGDFFSGKTLSM